MIIKAMQLICVITKWLTFFLPFSGFSQGQFQSSALAVDWCHLRSFEDQIESQGQSTKWSYLEISEYFITAENI